jgi:hypothetical protein
MKNILDPFKEYEVEYFSNQTNRSRKGEIIKIIMELTKMRDKSIIRKFRRLRKKDKSAQKKKQGRPLVYSGVIILALKKVWQLSGKICGELLHPMIKEYIEQYQKKKDWEHNQETTDKLLKMSLSTVKRRVKEFFKKEKSDFKKGLSATRPSSIKMVIPIRDVSWFEAKIGEGQLDTVVHCGNSLIGDMVYTLNFTDYNSYWIGLRAQWNKGQINTQKSLYHIKEHQLPFPMLSVHPDTGSEFINWHLKGWCDDSKVEMTRSRPNHKNDNMCVEERNGHIVRKNVGYVRLDCEEVVDVLNEYYESLCLFNNHFIAVRRTKEKIRVGAHYQRKFEIPKTPYQRIMDSNEISTEIKQKLKKTHESLSMIDLQKKLEILLKQVYDTQQNYRGKLY